MSAYFLAADIFFEKAYSHPYIFMTFIPLTISFVVVSIYPLNCLAKQSMEMEQQLGHPILRKLIYFSGYLITFGISWRYMNNIKWLIRKIERHIPRNLLLFFTTIWLLYGCYVGSKLDGMVDMRSGHVDMYNNFFPPTKADQ